MTKRVLYTRHDGDNNEKQQQQHWQDAARKVIWMCFLTQNTTVCIHLTVWLCEITLCLHGKKKEPVLHKHHGIWLGYWTRVSQMLRPGDCYRAPSNQGSYLATHWWIEHTALSTPDRGRFIAQVSTTQDFVAPLRMLSSLKLKDFFHFWNLPFNFWTLVGHQ